MHVKTKITKNMLKMYKRKNKVLKISEKRIQTHYIIYKTKNITKTKNNIKRSIKNI